MSPKLCQVLSARSLNRCVSTSLESRFCGHRPEHDANGNWTGSYACGYGGAIKNYCQCALYYPKAHNGDGYSFYMGGRSHW